MIYPYSAIEYTEYLRGEEEGSKALLCDNVDNDDRDDDRDDDSDDDDDDGDTERIVNRESWSHKPRKSSQRTLEATDILPPEFFAFQQGVALRDDNQTNELRGGLWKKKGYGLAGHILMRRYRVGGVKK